MKHKRILFPVVLVFLAGTTGCASWSCSAKSYSGRMETVTISEGRNETRTLIYLAEELGLFAANGISMAYKDYGSGAAAADALLKGEVDLAAGAEFVIVGGALRKDNVRTIASIDRFQNSYIIGRTDKGITGIASLRGKRIGVPRMTSPEFYLGRFLDINGMSIREVTPVNVAPAQALDALESGAVDAVAIFQPEASVIQQKLGNRVVTWPAQSGQLTYFNIFGTASWAADNTEVIGRLLQSLTQAEDYLANNPREARAIVQKRLGYDDAYINTIWTEHQFSVSLDQSLIVAMEDEARWMIRNSLTGERTVPNFLEYIYEEGLKAVRPEAVNIIR
ncbi:MAG: NrtA/SsuA/CpmA family ABC transporter substrate-binding protein [Chloroflexi bacterium]|nr:NrtA/SsuA/CpmA family ABC transporter substrate-binding protein [Chloroflexota bacterium]